MSSQLEEFQLDCAGRLRSEEYFSDIPVFVARPRSAAEAVLLQTRLDEALSGQTPTGGKCGLACTVQMPTATAPEADLPGPVFDAGVVVRVTENPVINMGPTGTGKSAEEAALAVLGALHQYVIEGLLVTAAEKALEARTADLALGKVVYECHFARRFGLAQQAKVAPVAIAISGTLPDVAVALGCATADAAIYYTTDGSFPSPENGTLYVSAFTVTAACRVRAAGYLEGMSGSNVAGRSIS